MLDNSVNIQVLHEFGSPAEYKVINLDDIVFNKLNDYEPTNIEELAADIKHNGLIHNIAVVDMGDGKYKLLAGERRTRALQMLQKGNPEKWSQVMALVYRDLTTRQEELIMDASNLHTRGVGGSEEQLRKATNRYMDNLIGEFGLTEKQALKATTDIYSGSGNTIRTNRKIGQGLSEELTGELNSGNLEKGDAAVIADMPEEEQHSLFEDLQDASDDDSYSEIVDSAVQKQTERKAAAKAEKKANKKKKADTDAEAEADNAFIEAGPVTTSTVDPRITTRLDYLDKIDGMTNQIKALNDQDTVAQMARLDQTAEEDGADTIALHINQMLVELTALKNALKGADGEFEIPIDPVYGHHRGNTSEEGYVAP